MAFIERCKVDGSFDQLNVLQDLNIELLAWWYFLKSLPKFEDFSARLMKSGNEQYQGLLKGIWRI